MKGPFVTVLVILMLGMVLGILYFSTTRAEAVTPTPTKSSILDETGKALGASCNAAQAYAFLESRKTSSGIQITPRLTGTSGSAQGGIDPELACRLEKLLKARPDIKIRSAYRSAAYQEQTCRRICGARSCPGRCAPPGGSCHQYGLAVDVTKGDSATRQYVKQFKLHYPYSGDHIQCIEHRTAGRSSCNTPCAKGGVQIGPGDYTPSSDVPFKPSSNIFGGQQNPLSSLLDSLGGGSPSGGSPGSGTGLTTDAFNQAYEPWAYGGEAGEQVDDNFFTGDGVPLFDELLGDFGEYGEGDEVRDVLGYDSATSTDGDVVPQYGEDNPANATSTTTSTDGEVCKNGVTTRNIYGNIICIRDSSAPTEGNSGDNFFQGNDIRDFGDTTSDAGGVGRTIAVIANQILPIRHLVDAGTVNQSPEERYLFERDRKNSYDAYTPSYSTAYGSNNGIPITEDDFVAWMLSQDLIEDDPTETATISVLLNVLRPMLFYITLVLFGTGSHAVNALLELSENI